MSPPQDLLQFLPVGELFDRLPDTVFFVKDVEGRYFVANTTLAMRCKRQKEELIGKLPSEVLGRTLGERYEAQDRSIVKTGSSILDRLELHIYPDRTVGWCVTNKFPLVSETGAIVGVTGISKDLGAPHFENDDFKRLKSVIAYVKDNQADVPTVQKLSQLADMSPYQLDRRIHQVFGLTTGQWVLKQRLDHAQLQLVQSDTKIAQIALDCGYEDQSAFSRQFRKTTGLTPSQFRTVYRQID